MLKQNVPLKDYSNYKIGGNASYFLQSFSKEQLVEGLKEWNEISLNFSDDKKRIFVLGSGTNVLFSDEGFNGLVIKNSIGGVEKVGDEVFVGAGVEVSKLIDFCIENSLSGLEWAGGLPGTIGGAVRGNAGAFGGEIKDSVKKIYSLDFNTLKEKTRNNKQCAFDYRFSVFKKREGESEIILSAVLKLKMRDHESIRQSVQEKIDYRKAKHPLEYPNIGSIFKNIPYNNLSPEYKIKWREYVKNDPFPVIPAAKIIFLAGLKGTKIGGAQISDKHTNFIVNLGNTTAKDVKAVIQTAKNTVKEKFDIILEEEITYLE